MIEEQQDIKNKQLTVWLKKTGCTVIVGPQQCRQIKTEGSLTAW